MADKEGIDQPNGDEDGWAMTWIQIKGQVVKEPALDKQLAEFLIAAQLVLVQAQRDEFEDWF